MWRAPIKIYQAGLGWLFGDRFLHLIHTGRNSGAERHAVIEVVRYDPAADTYIIASGFGKKSDWLRNLEKTPRARIEIGRRRLIVRAYRLPVNEAEEELLNYGQRHPTAIKSLARIMGYQLQNNEAGYRALGRELPVIALEVTGKA